MRFLKAIAAAYVIIFLVHGCAVQTPSNSSPKGSLFIIGGGNRSEALIADLIKTANLSPTDHIVILPMSSAEPEASFQAIATQLSKACKNNIGNLNFDPSTVTNQKLLDSLTTAKLIFITGGDQNRFMKAVLNTPVYAAIHKAYHTGSTIGGTSAGAAVMSKYMITGQQLLGDTTYKETFSKLWDKNIEFQQGLGLLENVIIDQHFLKRSRYNRILSALNGYPDYDCIGIDEGTALIVHGKTATISGESQVLKFSDPKGLTVNKKGLIKFEDVEFGAYTEGDSFLIK